MTSPEGATALPPTPAGVSLRSPDRRPRAERRDDRERDARAGAGAGRPRSACESPAVFCFDAADLDAVDRAGDAADAREREKLLDDEGRAFQTKGPQRTTAGLQMALQDTRSVATSTPIATNYGSDLHWTVQQPSAPHSPGALSWHGEAPTSSDKSSETGTGATVVPRLSRKESYKAQRQNYRREKKKAASALLSTLEDPAVLILADWLKVRGSLKSWTKLWCVLKPGLLLLYKSAKAKSNHWVGTVLLSACQVIERPSKKDGFCFKLYNPLEQSIWAPRGPHNETIGAVVQPLPTAHLIFRAPSQAAGKCWLDGLELALRCSNTLLRTSGGGTKVVDATANHETQWSPEDLERHFNEQVTKLIAIIVDRGQDGLNHDDTSSTLANVGDFSSSDYCDDVANEVYMNNCIVRWNDILSKFAGDSDCDGDPFSGDELSSGELEADEVVLRRNESENVSEKKRDSVFGLDFFRKNAFGTASLRTKIFKDKKIAKKDKMLGEKSDDRHKEKIKRSFSDPHDKPSVILTAIENDNSILARTSNRDTHNFFEENLLRIVSAFPKRRSSTPSTFFKISAKEESSARCKNEDRKICSFNEITIRTDDSKPQKPFVNLHLSGRRSAEPRMVTTDVPRRQESFFPTRFAAGGRSRSPPTTDGSRDATPDRFSLIRYEKLPSVVLDQKLGRQISERHSQQGNYVAGQIVKEKELDGAGLSDSDSERAPGKAEPEEGGVLTVLKNAYADEPSDHVPQSGEVVEELGEENKSLLWFLIKQVRPGMDLSKVVLPTFILEPRSFLDKLSDSFYHSDILARACKQTSPLDRMKTILAWYLSGLYRKPRGLKKPYNPVLGETFRCSWLHPDSGTRTYYVSEQVSHHPPVSAFYVSNRKEGFAIEATILAKSKFYGNSTSAILEGVARVALLPLGEAYLCTSPYAHCKGLLLGTLSMELGGRVTIHCPATDYTAEVDFKLKPFIGGSDSINMVSGRIRHHKDTVATIEGHWDGRIDLRDKKSQEEVLLMDAGELKGKRLKRQLVVPERLGEFESQRLWSKVSEAIANEDQVAATEQKTIIEEGQRERARELGLGAWQPRHFNKALFTDGQSIPQSHGSEASHTTYQYNYHNFTPWDDAVDVLEYEEDYIIKTLRRQNHTVTSRTSLQTRPLPETEHSASETDSTNSHHNPRTPSQSQQAVAAALLRVEAALQEQRAALASVGAAVRRLRPPPEPSRAGPLALGALLLAVLAQAAALYCYSR